MTTLAEQYPEVEAAMAEMERQLNETVLGAPLIQSTADLIAATVVEFERLFPGWVAEVEIRDNTILDIMLHPPMDWITVEFDVWGE